MRAECQCGKLSVDLPGPSPLVVACHCLACQRRSGSPFAVLTYYPADRVKMSGRASEYERPTDEGNRFTSYFCPTCGSTVYVRASKHPGLIGVPVGTIGDPAYPPPVRSAWEQTRHAWVTLPDGLQRFPRGPS